MSDEKRDDIIGGIINESCSNLLSSDVRNKERTANIFTRMGKTISNAAILVQKTLSAGNFAENGMEYEFEEDISDAVALKGKIDRIDICRDGDKSYLRIIDYKTCLLYTSTFNIHKKIVSHYIININFNVLKQYNIII